MRSIKLILLLFCATLAQAVDVGLIYIPNTTTTVTTNATRIYAVHLANTTGSAATVTIADRSTNCNSGTCQLWPTVSIAAHTVYTADLRGVYVANGFTWESNTENAVIGWVSYSACNFTCPE